MLQKENFSEEHIRKLQTDSHNDPILLERAVYAFGLLEALTRVGMPFVFKGGTSLMLLMDHPRRLSTDIDIVVEPGTDLNEFLRQAAELFPFKAVDEQKRIGKNEIEKRHFKFTYDSPINNKPLYILLDVLFEENNYTELLDKEIRNDLLLTVPEYLTVKIPSVNCILADKLTAFAPHTTGVLLDSDKDMEIMKQFYDISSLLDVFMDFRKVTSTYRKVVKSEIDYRGIALSSDDCLWDTFRAALSISSRGKVNPDEYAVYVKGIRELRNHIYTEKYSPEIAATNGPQIMYMAVCLLSDTVYERAVDYNNFLNIKLTQDEMKSLQYLRKVSAEAYAYAVKTDQLLSEM